MTHQCLDCRLVSDELADGRYCSRCRSGLLRPVTPEPRTSGVKPVEGPEHCD